MEKINFQDLPSTSTPLNSTNLNQMQDNMEDAIIPIKLVTISTSAPSGATTGDMYYNTTDNKVYTAIGENTWDSGSTPRYDGFYVNTSDNTLFYYNGTTLVGAGGSQTSINVKNEETTSETDVYSCNYINKIIHILWTNSNPSNAMGANVQINLSSSDYDALLWIFTYSTTTNNGVSAICLKGQNVHATTMGYGNPTLVRRTINYVSNTLYTTNIAKFGESDSNTQLIPVSVVGIKF